MKQFDWEKHPDIDVVAWDKNGQFCGVNLYFSEFVPFWTPSRVIMPEYDINPTTEGFDWTKSKQIRPQGDYRSNLDFMQECIVLRFENDTLKANIEACNAQLEERIAELKKKLDKKTKEVHDLVYEDELSNRNYVNEKLIDFTKDRLLYELNRSSPFDDNQIQELKEQIEKEVEILKQAIERIEKNEGV